jgi:hypothetical protein
MGGLEFASPIERSLEERLLLSNAMRPDTKRR